MSRLSRYGNGPLVSAVVGHIGRLPNLVRVLVLICAAAVVTFGIQVGSATETVPSEKLSVLQPVIVAEDRVNLVVAESVDSSRQTVRCPYHCFRAPVVRPRVEDFWYAALLIAGLLLGGAGHRAWYCWSGVVRRAAAGAAGAQLLLRLCVCRR